MNKQELVAHISERAGISKRSAEDALNATLDVIMETLQAGDKVQLVGFGSFEVIHRNARSGVNPRTKERILLSPSKSVKFRPSSPLRKLLNQAQ